MQVILTEIAMGKLRNSQILAELSVKTKIPYTRLTRWINERHEYLTLYRVLFALADITNSSISELIKIQE